VIAVMMVMVGETSGSGMEWSGAEVLALAKHFAFVYAVASSSARRDKTALHFIYMANLNNTVYPPAPLHCNKVTIILSLQSNPYAQQHT